MCIRDSRYPFQLVDKVVAIGANHIVGVKNVTANEPFFQGHFPQEPVMPLSLIHISDAKRGDIGNTSAMYARTFFEQLDIDSVTVAPYMGDDSVNELIIVSVCFLFIYPL